MKIENVKITDLKPLEKNVRKHTDTQINELIRSLNQFGQTRAIIIDEDNNILIGNGLYFAMQRRGDETAECSRIKGLSETQKKKLVLSDNKIFSLGLDHFENIEAFIHDISDDGDFDIAGFDEEVIRQMTRELEEISADVGKYGLIPDGYVKPQESAPVQAAAEDDTVKQEAAPYSAPVETIEAQQAEVKTQKSVICPSCGEVIYLD